MGRAQNPEIEDPYLAKEKPAEPSACPNCGAVFRKGRWKWPDLPDKSARPVVCTACRRIAENLPAGSLTLEGGYVRAHGDEMIHLINHRSEQERKEHPMNRVMGLDRAADRIVVRTTDIHLPRRLGQALRRAFHGKLEVTYDADAYGVRVNWRRDE
jgi:hypothetical protein